jgi:hypothetical protein
VPENFQISARPPATEDQTSVAQSGIPELLQPSNP